MKTASWRPYVPVTLAAMVVALGAVLFTPDDSAESDCAHTVCASVQTR
ncbi:hypothetical protein [Mycolicibacterium mengxianglii]|nr:hypothetical protein [Mycolicibacterium mengxianglii]